MTFSDKIDDAVNAEKIATIFRQMPIALAVNLINAALVSSVLTPIASRPLPPLWFGAVVLVTSARWLLWCRYRSGRGTGDAHRWAALATYGSLSAGVCWGVGCAVLWFRPCSPSCSRPLCRWPFGSSPKVRRPAMCSAR